MKPKNMKDKKKSKNIVLLLLSRTIKMYFS